MRSNPAWGFVVAGLIASLGGGAAFGENFARPGDTLSFPTPIINATADGEPGGDTISSMKLIVIGAGVLVTNAMPSETQSLAPGEEKTFTPSFVVGDVLEGPYSVTLHMVSPDAGIFPDPDSPESDIVFSFTIDRTPPDAVVLDRTWGSFDADCTGLSMDATVVDGRSRP